MFGRCAGLLLPILNGKTVERSERGGDFCYRDKAYCTLAGWRVEKGEIIITDGRFLVERIALSLFKRWIYALQRYKKCYKIHNLQNKKCPNSLVFDVFA